MEGLVVRFRDSQFVRPSEPAHSKEWAIHFDRNGQTVYPYTCNDHAGGVTFCVVIDVRSSTCRRRRGFVRREISVPREKNFFPNALSHAAPRDTIVAREMEEDVGDDEIDVIEDGGRCTKK